MLERMASRSEYANNTTYVDTFCHFVYIGNNQQTKQKKYATISK
jgi:hypothetical protein